MTNLASRELTWQHGLSQFVAYIQYAIRFVQVKQASCWFELIFFDGLHRKKLNAWLKRSTKHSLRSIFSMSYILCTNMSLEMDTCGYLKAMDNHLMEQQ